MPRIRGVDEQQEIEYEIQLEVDRLIADLRRKRIDRKALLRKCGISNSALSQHLTNGTMTFKIYIAWQKLLRERENEN